MAITHGAHPRGGNGGGRRRDHVEDRLGRVEQDLGRMQADVRGLGTELGFVKKEVETVVAGINQLLARDQRRGEPHSWQDRAKMITVTVGALIGIGWCLDSYLATRFGDVRGLVTTVERHNTETTAFKLRIERLESAIEWTPTIKSARH